MTALKTNALHRRDRGKGELDFRADYPADDGSRICYPQKSESPRRFRGLFVFFGLPSSSGLRGVVTALERSEPPGFGARVRALLLVSMPPLNTISSRDPGKPVYRSDVAQARQRERSKLWARRDAQSTRGRARRMRHSAANRAKKKRVPFSISVDDVLAQIPSDMRCPVLGLLFATDGSGAAMTIDCVIPKLGYQPGNFRVISKRANSLKYHETTPWRLLNALTHRGTREDQILVANYITREVPKVHALFAHAP